MLPTIPRSCYGVRPWCADDAIARLRGALFRRLRRARRRRGRRVSRRWRERSRRRGRPRAGAGAYLPPSYGENTRERFPVIYFHDGQNLFDSALAFGGNEWRVDETFDTGAEDGSIREAIAIGIGNTADRIWEYTPTDGGMGGGG